MRASVLLTYATTLVVSCLLAGCSASFAPDAENTGEVQFGPMSGTAYGGQSPIVGAHIYAYQTSISGYGAASTSLLGATDTGGYQTSIDGSGNYYVTTDSKGYFQIASTTTCTTNRVVYLYSVTGNPGGGINSAAGLMAVLGTCPASGLLINAITTGTSVQIYMNEVSTVAAAYALSGFATSATAIGNTGTTLGNTGIQNAAANASQMYTAVASSDGGTGNNGTSRAALATTPGGNGTVPQMTLDTLANILAACINSAGPTSSVCLTLRADATSDGTSTGTKAPDTATAAIYIAHNPTANVTALYNIAGSTASPFTPALAAAPTTWIIELIFTGGGVDELTIPLATNLAIDGSGNVWIANDYGSEISKISPLGVSLAGTGYTSSSCGFTGTESSTTDPTAIAINAASTQVWITYQTKSGVCVLSSTGATVANTAIGTGDGSDDGPYGIAFDSAGNAWITDDLGTGGNDSGDAAAGQLYEVNPTTYAATLKASGNTNGLNGPYGIAIQSNTGTTGHNGDIWVANFNNALNGTATPDSVFTSTGGNESFSPVSASTAGRTGSSNLYGAGMAIDSNGYVWTVVNDLPGGVDKASYTGTSGTYYAQNSAYVPFSIAIDGAGNVWYTSETNGNGSPFINTVLEVNNSGTRLSPAAGFVPIGTVEPLSIAIDGSGNVWYDEGTTNNTLRELIGAATPVATPIAYGVLNNELGSRP